MDIKPIKTKKNYEKALADLDRLFDAKPNTPDGDYVEILAALIEKYENEHFPIEAPDPVRRLNTSWRAVV